MTTKSAITVNELRDLLSQLIYDPDRLRSVVDTAKYLGATEGAVRALIKRGELKSLQIGTADYVAQSAIHEWIAKSHEAQDVEGRRRRLAAEG